MHAITGAQLKYVYKIHEYTAHIKKDLNLKALKL